MIQRLKRKPLVVAKALALVRDAKKTHTKQTKTERNLYYQSIQLYIKYIYIFAKHDEKIIEATLKAVEETRKRKKEREQNNA